MLPRKVVEEKQEVVPYPYAVISAAPLEQVSFVPFPQNHAMTWQKEMNHAFTTFLAGIKTQLIETGALTPRPILLTYAAQPEEECFEDKKALMSEIAQQLAGYLAAAGLPPILNAIDFYEPEEAITALKSQLDQEPDTQVIVLSTPAYKTLANDQNKRLSQLLVEFGKDKKDSVLLLMCLGGSATASQILPRHFLYRDCKALLRSFDGPQGGMPDFLDMLVSSLVKMV